MDNANRFEYLVKRRSTVDNSVHRSKKVFGKQVEKDSDLVQSHHRGKRMQHNEKFRRQLLLRSGAVEDLEIRKTLFMIQATLLQQLAADENYVKGFSNNPLAGDVNLDERRKEVASAIESLHY